MCESAPIRLHPRLGVPGLVLFALAVVSAHEVGAQNLDWNSTLARALVTNAALVREQQVADTMLRDYTAEARGFLTFHGQLTEGIRTPPLLVKATEIESRLYWMQPGRSKQVIVGMRDTLFMPGDIGYYQERYGIIQNNFPDVIRLGAGRDVRDVPHPISRAGLELYDFAITDSLSIVLAGRTIDVYEVTVRPKTDSLPRVVGRVYIESISGSIARMSFTFTRASFIDKRNESLAVTLENGLVEGRFWLPRRQELDLVRRSDVLDFPVRTIIRARWEVCCYDVNLNFAPSVFVGPEIVSSSPSILALYEWERGIAEVLPPDVRVLSPGEATRIKTEAEQLVRNRALVQKGGASMAARRVSDFVTANRVEGLALGVGARLRNGSGLAVTARGRYGFWDREPKGSLTLSLANSTGSSVELFAQRDYAEVSPIAERSRSFNSFAAPIFGSDFTDLYDRRAVGLTSHPFPEGGLNPTVSISYESHAPLTPALVPLSGDLSRITPAERLRGVVASISIAKPQGTAPGGGAISWSGNLEYGALRDHSDAARSSRNYLGASGRAELQHEVGRATLVTSGYLALVESEANIPLHKMLYFGGPVSAPGYDFHELTGAHGGFVRSELRFPVPFFSIPLGKYGRSPAHATLAPFVSAAYVGGLSTEVAEREGVYPSVGIGALFLFDLLRVDVARGLHDGRWSFSLDMMREIWGIL